MQLVIKGLILALATTTVSARQNFDAADYWMQQQQYWARQQYHQEEMENWARGAANVQADWSPSGRVGKTYAQLQTYSGMQFQLYAAQNFNWGQAHAGGVILLDLSTVGQGESQPDVFAFKLAHEWGHEALGHQPNFYNPNGGAYRYSAIANDTSSEDAADAYAGAFLAEYKYDASKVAEYLKGLPENPSGDTHSSGPERAKTVTRAFEARKQTLENATCKVSIAIQAWEPGRAAIIVGIWIDNKFVGLVQNNPHSPQANKCDFSVPGDGERKLELRAMEYNWVPNGIGGWTVANMGHGYRDENRKFSAGAYTVLRGDDGNPKLQRQSKLSLEIPGYKRQK